MGKYIAICIAFTGIVSLLYQWMQEQKRRQKQEEVFLYFLQKTLYAMEREQIRLIPYFLEYESGDKMVQKFLQELGKRLQSNQYPQGEHVWKEIFNEQKKEWKCNQETYDILYNAGRGFFCKNRKENICFLQKSIWDLEQQLGKNKEKDMQERKVWLPVSLLGSLMFMILWI